MKIGANFTVIHTCMLTYNIAYQCLSISPTTQPDIHLEMATKTKCMPLSTLCCEFPTPTIKSQWNRVWDWKFDSAVMSCQTLYYKTLSDVRTRKEFGDDILGCHHTSQMTFVLVFLFFIFGTGRHIPAYEMAIKTINIAQWYSQCYCILLYWLHLITDIYSALSNDECFLNLR